MLQVTGEIYKEKLPNVRGDRAHVCWRIPTPQGDLTTGQVAEILGMSRGAIVHRIKAHIDGVIGRDDVLLPPLDPKLRRPSAQKKKAKTDEDPAELQCSIPESEWGKYAQLSGRSRGERLSKIKVGRWDARRGRGEN
jgi:hypothetical protein